MTIAATALKYRFSEIPAPKAVNITIVIPKPASFHESKTETFVKPVRPGIHGHWIDQDLVDSGLFETARDNHSHDRGAVTFSKVFLVAKPDVDRTTSRADLSPIMSLLQPRIDDLNKPDRASVELGDQLFAPLAENADLMIPIPFTRA